MTLEKFDAIAELHAKREAWKRLAAELDSENAALYGVKFNAADAGKIWDDLLRFVYNEIETINTSVENFTL